MTGARHPFRCGTAIVVAVALLALRGAARADTVDDLVKQLATSSSYKDRLSAAASLAKEADERAIAAFIAALVGDTKDAEKTVRGAAAVGLGKVVTSATSLEDRTRAIDALTRATKDKDSFVKKQAKKALAKLEKLGDSTGAEFYVDLGPMVSNLGSTSPSDGDLAAAMHTTLEHVVHRNAKDWLTELPGDGEVTQVQAYYVDGEVSEVIARTTGTGTTLACRVRMRIATSPGKSALVDLSGGARVQAANALADLEAATYDCVNAVIEDLVIKKIIPFIADGKQLSGSTGSTSAAATTSPAPELDAPAWSPDGWTLLGEDDVDLVDDVVEVDRRKSTWAQVAIVVTGDEVQLDTVDLALAGKGRKREHADLAQTFTADSHPHIIELTGKRRAIDQVRLTYTKHKLDGQTRVQVWAR